MLGGIRECVPHSGPASQAPLHHRRHSPSTGSGRPCPRPVLTTSRPPAVHQARGVHVGRPDDQRVQRRCPPAAVRLRARRDAVHHGEHHRAAAAHPHSPVPGAPRRGCTTARPSSRSTRATSRSASPRCSPRRTSRLLATATLLQNCEDPLLISDVVVRHRRHDPHHDGGNHPHHVARRAHHRARDRQRHVAPDLHVDRRGRSPRRPCRSWRRAGTSPASG